MSVIYVPIPLPVKKYFLKEFRNQIIQHNNIEALKLSRSDFLGNFVACLMTNDLTDWKLTRPERESLCLVLSRRFDNCYVTDNNKVKLAYHLEQWFKREFCLYIDMCVNFNMPALRAVDHFCRMYDIEEQDYGQDNMYRYYTRYGKKHISVQTQHVASLSKTHDHASQRNHPRPTRSRV
jgi:hypothetical protein